MKTAGILVGAVMMTALTACTADTRTSFVTPSPKIPDRGWSVVPETGELLYPGASGRVVHREIVPPHPELGGTNAWELTTADGEEGFQTFRVMEMVYNKCPEDSFYPDCMLPPNNTTPKE